MSVELITHGPKYATASCLFLPASHHRCQSDVTGDRSEEIAEMMFGDNAEMTLVGGDIIYERRIQNTMSI